MIKTIFRPGVVERVQDVEPILERNRALQNEPQRSDWGRHVASIPLILIEKWMNEEHARGNMIKCFGPEMDALVARKLRDPEWKWLRADGPKNAVLLKNASSKK